MEFIAEVLFEIFFDVFVAFAETIVDENKHLTKRQKAWLRILSAVVTIVMVGCLVFGILMLCENGYSVLGVTLTAVGGGLLLLELIMGLITFCRQSHRRQPNNKTDNPDNGAVVK